MDKTVIEFIFKSSSIITLFNLFNTVKHTTLETRTSTRNLSKEILDSQKITKPCCRSRIISNVDFYISRNYYATKLQ